MTGPGNRRRSKDKLAQEATQDAEQVIGDWPASTRNEQIAIELPIEENDFNAQTS